MDGDMAVEPFCCESSPFGGWHGTAFDCCIQPPARI
ncbi:hypothetical protein BCO18175_02787 [Burkholderia contaminans]|uniref:Uncharacterized protein n=3 Tax=Burkholderia cepacia complex TaxID=87882 RepID=A0A6P3BL00_9BURK|nr:hypothetical protein BLA3211_07131 [Burkholderia aenigmatica]VWB19431.1 hypothetical protein BME24068_00738 [Burkholderia metallica]VWC60814.1 hypothetical protein BLA18109_01541 [Burkholderia lata]VWC82266.1 hypothetical protein BCO18175_02787 [Burkholderia contaminans]VWD57298.1 hypothetical protein BCO71033_06057 [Burkholderia contaminans]